MIFNLQKIDLLVIISTSICKFSIGFISCIVIPIFPTLIDRNFNESILIQSDLSIANESLRNSNFSYEKLAILYSVKYVCQFFFGPLFGYLCGVSKPLNIIVLGNVFQIFTLIFYGLSNKFYQCIIGRIIDSMSSSAIFCGVATHLSQRYLDHKKLGFIHGISGLLLCIGAALGPVYGGWVFQYKGRIVTFSSVISLVILEMILIISLITVDIKIRKKKLNYKKENNEINSNSFSKDEVLNTNLLLISNKNTLNSDDNNETISPAIENFIDSQEKIKKQKSQNKLKSISIVGKFVFDVYFMVCTGALAIIYASIYILYATLPRYMKITFNTSESQQGLIWLLNLLGYIVGFILGNILNAKFSKFRHIFLIMTIYIQSIATLSIAFLPNWWSIAIPLCFLVMQHMIFEIIITPIISKIVTTNQNSNFGIMTGFVLFTLSLVSSGGSFLGPIIYSKIGILYLNLISFLIGIILGPFLYILKKFV